MDRSAPETVSATIDSPLDYQVFQRQRKDSGKVLIDGRVDRGCPKLEGRFLGSSISGIASNKWKQIPLDCGSHLFRTHWSLPTGGFYRFELRGQNGAATVLQQTVAHVGVGEVFVIAGQSNATNYGEVRQQVKSGMVTSFDGHTWQIANDPQPGVQDHSLKGSFIPAFGDELYQKYRVPIGVACVGHGSTSVRQWLPAGAKFELPPTKLQFVREGEDGKWESTGELFNGMMERMRQLGLGGFRALLWHQGESDANQQSGHEISSDEYRLLMESLIRDSRREAGWDFPWFVAEVSFHNDDDPSSSPIREAQRTLWQEGIALQGPDTDTLTGDYRQNHGKGVHFSEAGLQAHGKLWAEKVGNYLDKVFALSSTQTFKFPAQGIYQGIFSRRKKLSRETRINIVFFRLGRELSGKYQGISPPRHSSLHRSRPGNAKTQAGFSSPLHSISLLSGKLGCFNSRDKCATHPLAKPRRALLLLICGVEQPGSSLGS